MVEKILHKREQEKSRGLAKLTDVLMCIVAVGGLTGCPTTRDNIRPDPNPSVESRGYEPNYYQRESHFYGSGGTQDFGYQRRMGRR